MTLEETPSAIAACTRSEGREARPSSRPRRVPRQWTMRLPCSRTWLSWNGSRWSRKFSVPKKIPSGKEGKERQRTSIDRETVERFGSSKAFTPPGGATGTHPWRTGRAHAFHGSFTS